MMGYANDAYGYPSNLQPALAAAVDAGGANADTAWSRFDSRSVKPKGDYTYEHRPNYAIIPRR